MASMFGLNPYIAQLIVWFLGFVTIALFGTLACFVAGLTNGERGRI
jgi:phage shock protein PspC (stress-responsive transcriptional regulator)